MQKYIIACLIFCFTTSSSAGSLFNFSNQLITISARDKTLSSILEDIEKISEINFQMDESIENERISIQFKNEELEKALIKLLKDYNKSFEYDKIGNIIAVHVISSSFQKKLGEAEKRDNQFDNNSHDNNTPITSFNIAYIEENPPEMSNSDTASVPMPPPGIVNESPPEMSNSDTASVPKPSTRNNIQK